MKRKTKQDNRELKQLQFRRDQIKETQERIREKSEKMIV
jgi:hypothetical protein